MSKVYNDKIVEGRWDRQDNQMSLFKDDGNDPNGDNWNSGDFSKTGKWVRSPNGWTIFDILDHGEYFKDIKYLYLSEVGGEGKDKCTVYKY